MNSPLPPDQLDGIAIIGMAGCFPGARTLEEFWQNLCNGVESITRFSEQQLLDAGLDPAMIHNPQYVRAKGVIEDIDLFDAAFFGFSPREARTMDPQHRLFLECAWEALERAGYDPGRYEDRIGVYAGCSMNTYMLATYLFQQFSMAGDPVPAILGSDKDFLATRVSYKLNLRGPSITVQTACSTSLVAVHMACQSLLNHECSMVLAGGVSVHVPQNVGYLYQGEGIVSPDGHCRAFDAQGSGTVIGEGVGIVVLKRLEDALAAKDCIFAIIKGSAINNDGAAKVGYTAPSHAGQAEVIEEALAIAGVEPKTISYVEAHGTGTALGDPLELAALTQVYRTSTDAKQFCAIGSVKTNIGHLDAAAGVTGLIKATLALHYKRIPPSLNFEKPNPQIDFVHSPFYVNTTLATWAKHSYPRRAGVSSFGIGGTNVHLILEEAPQPTEALLPMQLSPLSAPTTQFLTISARSPQALQDLLHTYETWFDKHTDLPLHAICAVASLRRAHHEYRLALVGSTHQMLAERARAYKQTGEFTRSTPGALQGKVVFVFPGQGSQWAGMGRTLLEQEPIFREQIQRCEAAFRPYVDWSLRDILSTATEWQDISIIQPVLFAFQIALAALWQSWGVVPDAVIGHSMGEIAAACIAGSLSLEEGARIICRRSQSLRRISGKGAMALIGLTRAMAEQEIIGYEGHVSIAVSNSHHSTVLAGEPPLLEAIGQSLAARDIFWRYVKVDVASHSPQVEVLRAELLESLQGLQPQPAQVAFYSTVEGKRLTGVELLADYWMRNLREPVQFASTVECLFTDEHTLFLEISPHPLLITALQEHLEEAGKDGLALPSLRREQDERTSMLQTLGSLYEQGLNVDWTTLYPTGSSNLPLPTYPFQRKRYWLENQEVAKPQPLPQITLQQRSSAWLYQLQWEARSRKEVSNGVSAQAGNWIILADTRGVGMALAERLRAIGDVPFIVMPATEFEKDQEGQYRINPLLLEDIQWMLDDITQTSQLPCKGIVHLWNLDAVSTQEITPDALDCAEKVGCGSIIQILQAIERSGQKPRLWLITRNAQPVADTAISLELAQAPVWGLGQTIAIEHTDIWGGLIDLDTNRSPDEDSALLLTEFLSPDGEDQIAYRRETRYCARLVHSSNPETRPVTLKADAIYLITGGLGYLGLKVADQLVELGARQIWLIGRKDLSEYATDLYECKAIIRSLEEKGATVHVIPADVSNPDHIKHIAARLQEESAPLCGIVHAAGVSTPRELREMTPQQLQESLRPKVTGTWLLHQLTQHAPLDFFISFSSIVSLWGSRGLAHHAAANRFLDAFAHYRRAHGYPATTINWGPWEGGDHGSSIAQTRLERLGLTSFSSETGKEVLSTLLNMHTAQMAVVQIDWNLFKPGYEAQTSRHLLEQIQVQAPSLETSGPVSTLSLRLKNAQPGEQREMLDTFVRGEVAAVLGIEQPQTLDARRPLRELGLESLMSVELRNRLQLGIRPTTTLPATLVFEYPTIEALVIFLQQDVAGIPDQQAEKATDQTRTPLSEEDLTASLLEELERAGY